MRVAAISDTHGRLNWTTLGGARSGMEGSTALTAAVITRNVQQHVFGHLDAAGSRMLQQEHTMFYNVAACDDAYELVNLPHILDVKASSA